MSSSGEGEIENSKAWYVNSDNIGSFSGSTVGLKFETHEGSSFANATDPHTFSLGHISLSNAVP